MSDEAVATVGVNFIGEFSALAEEGATAGDPVLIDPIPEALSSTKVACSSVNMGSSCMGIDMDAVWAIGEAITASAQATENGLEAAELVVFADSVGDNPFMAGVFHSIKMSDCIVSIGVPGPDVTIRAITSAAGESFDALVEAVKKSAFKITHVGELVRRMTAEHLGVSFGIVDLSLVPTSGVDDSMAHTLEAMGLERVGACGMMAALALLNGVVKEDGLMAYSRVDGLLGSFIPVSEDGGVIRAMEVSAISLAELETMMTICSMGLNMVAVPDDTPSSAITEMIADEATIGVMNHKTTAIWTISTLGTTPSDVIESGGSFGKAPAVPVNPCSSEAFIGRGELMPVPAYGFKN